jgi:hypothetical protein
VPDPGPGEVLVRNTWTSVDPALRLRLREQAPRGYFAAFPLGEPMTGISTVGEVVASRAPGFAAGDVVRHGAGWREFAVVRAGAESLGGIATLTRLDVDAAPPEAYLGALGASGLTAYAGLFHVAELRDGDIVWVSAAAGSVTASSRSWQSSAAITLSAAPSDEKVRYLLGTLGLDAAFNCKRGALPELLRAAAPKASTSTSTTSAAIILEAAIGPAPARPRRDVRRSPSDISGRPGAVEPVPRGRERPHASRIPRLEPSVLLDEMVREVGGGSAQGESGTSRLVVEGSSTPRRRSRGCYAATRMAMLVHIS